MLALGNGAVWAQAVQVDTVITTPQRKAHPAQTFAIPRSYQGRLEREVDSSLYHKFERIAINYERRKIVQRSAGQLGKGQVHAYSGKPAGTFKAVSDRLPNDMRVADANYAISNLDIEHGLESNNVSTLYFAPNGDVWIGYGSGGVSCLRGQEIFHITEREGLGNAEVTCIKGYGDAIWVGTFGGGLFRIDNGHVQHYGKRNGFATDHLLDMEVYQSALWIGTYGAGLLRYDGRQFTAYDSSGGKVPIRVPSLCVDKTHDLLYFSGDEGTRVFCLDQRGKVDTFSLRAYLPAGDGVADLSVDQGALHVLAGGGVHVRIDGDAASVYAPANSARYSTILCSQHLGSAWMGANDGSIWRADGDIVKGITHNEGLSKSAVGPIGEDLSGNIWVGSQGHGIFVLANSPFRTLLSEGSPLYSPNSSVMQHPEGIFVPTTKGLSLMLDNKLLIHHRHPLLKNLRGIAVEGDRIWACGFFGLVELAHDSVFLYRVENDPERQGLNSNLNLRLARDGKSLHLSNYNHGLIRFDIASRSFLYYDEIADISLTNVTFEDSKGRIWIGSPTGGICYLEGARRTDLNNDFGEVHSFAEDLAGNVWIGTAFGLLQYTPQNRLFAHKFTEGKSNNEVRALLYLPSDNTLWIGTAKGLLQYLPASGHVRHFTRAQGISGTYFSAHAAIATASSSFWINNKGLLQHNWGNWATQRQSPSLRLVSIDLNALEANRDWSAAEASNIAEFDSLEWGLPINLTLSDKVRQLEFHFSTGSWFAADNHTLYYRFGKAGEWIPSANAHSVALFGLRSMAYEVFFKAVSMDGAESPVISYRFVVQKPFYLELWFMLLVAIFGGFLGYYFLKRAFHIRFENARSYSDQDAYLKRVRLLGAILAIGLPVSELTESGLDIPGYVYWSYAWMTVSILAGVGLWVITFLRQFKLEWLRQVVQVLTIAVMLMMTIRTQQSDYAPTFTIGFIVVFSFAAVILDNIQSFLRFVVAVGMMLAYTFVWIDTNNPDHLLFLTNFPLAFLFGGVYHVLQLYKISNLLFGDQILRVYDKYVLVCDPEGRIVYCNEHVLTELNLPEEYLLGEGWWGILGVRKPAMAGIREAIRTRMAGDLSAEVFPDKLLKPGRKQPCTLQWEYQVIESGYLMGIGTDVSERIEQETMIRTLSLIASTTENMVVITDMDRKIEWVNSSFCRTTGYSFEEVHGQNPDDLLQGPETDHHIAQTIRLALQQGQPWRGEVINYAKSGRPFWVMIDLQPILDEKDQVHKFVSLSIDVTEKKLREIEMLKAIEEGEQKYKLISDNTSDGIAILDAAGRFVFTSPSYLALLRYPAQTYLDADQAAIAALIHPEDRDIPFRAYREALTRRREHARYTYRIRHSEGHYIWEEDSATFVYDAANKHQKTYIIARDVTEQVQKEEEREQLLKELTYSFEELQQFSFITQHNLRAPVANFLGLISMIELEQIDHPLLPRFLSAMRVTAEGFEQTIQDLNTVLRVKNRADVTFSALHLHTSLQVVLEVHADEILAIAPKIKANFTAAPMVRFNAQYMHSIFSNLITNALKFKAEDRVLEIDIHSAVDDKMVCLTFSDNGIGLDVERHQDRIFGLYQRFHGDRDGKGFGLYLLKSQVESAGGRVAAEGTSDQGFTVRIWLPSGADPA